jgi:hypothetical protein
MRALALLLALAVSASAADFVPLFSGKDTTGWTATLRPPKDKPDSKPDPKDTWSVRDGVLVCTGKPNGYLATATEYGDYTLKLKWRYPVGTVKPNSGVLLHLTGPDKVWPNCVEMQLKGGFAGDFWRNPAADGKMPAFDGKNKDAADKTDRHYLRIPKDDIEKPLGEWNECEITTARGAITVSVNGQKANESTGGALKKGRIALQSEGSAVEFKDILIRARK